MKTVTLAFLCALTAIAPGARAASTSIKIELVSPRSSDAKQLPVLRASSEVLVNIIEGPDKATVPLKLYLSGREVASLPATAAAPLPLIGQHSFKLQMPGGNAAIVDMLREQNSRKKPPGSQDAAGNPVGISLEVGLADSAARSNSIQVELVGLTRLGILFCAGTLILLLTIGWWKWKSTLLKEDGCFSLARVQMAFWTLLVMPAFVYIFSTMGRLDSLNKSVLALIGISAATSLGAVAIGNAKRDDTMKRIGELRPARLKAVNDQAQAVANFGAATNLLQAQGFQIDQKLAEAEVARIDAELAYLTVRLKPVSDGFWTDILSDSSGINLHRFQLVAWTIVLGVIFSWNTLTKLTMADFDATLLALMGVSSGTYLGFKYPEK